MNPSNDDPFKSMTIADWFFNVCVTVGAVSVFAFALAVTL